ncbi:YgfZ/GcvT domain-containing protein [Pelagicoccus albus]|uniref:GCVT N-terminal domain-containing protein n=1 Tax=Pelagicoccus albus TaxID=415222 RepID=A0A7X1B900_9BACT|nr:hypothetical protein [Pelagicoccus albus]MBC2606570.1 hypothetical protein [Pelagicoccus albus]
MPYSPYTPACVIEVSGPDAGEFLQGQFSNDLSSLETGEMSYGLWLDRKGKIVADSFVLRRKEEEYLLVSYYCPEALVYERLDSYLIMEDAELRRRTSSVSAYCLLGLEDSFELPDGLPLPADGKFVESQGLIVFAGRRGEGRNFEMLALDEDSSAAAAAFVDSLEWERVEDAELKALAVRSKCPEIGRGFGSSDLPQELGLEREAVSFKKGCYLGQEVMARLNAMGRVRKTLALLRIEFEEGAEALVLPIDLIDGAGKKQGQVRSISGDLGLAIVNLGFDGDMLNGAGASFQLLRGSEEADL